MPHLETDNGNGNGEKVLRQVKLLLSIVGIVGSWALGLTVWLVTMNSEVAHLRLQNTEQNLRIDRIDQSGSRALDLVRNTQQNAISTVQAHEARVRELENKLGDMQRAQIETKFWLDQLTKQNYRLQGVNPSDLK